MVTTYQKGSKDLSWCGNSWLHGGLDGSVIVMLSDFICDARDQKTSLGPDPFGIEEKACLRTRKGVLQAPKGES